jgi:hypothetical protein
VRLSIRTSIKRLDFFSAACSRSPSGAEVRGDERES